MAIGEIKPSTLQSVMLEMQYGTAHLPQDDQWVRDLEDLVYRDLLAIADGNRERAYRLFIEFMAAVLGDMLFRAGGRRGWVAEEFNTAIARRESKMSIRLTVG